MPFNHRQMLAYFRDGFVPFTDANISIAASPVLYGLAVYTVFNASWNQTDKTTYFFRLSDHYRRLKESAQIMDFAPIESVISEKNFIDVAKQLIVKNSLHEDTLIRATLFIDEEIAGTKTYGLKTSFSAYAYPLGEILPRSGIHLCVSSWQRTSDNAIPSRAKINGSYVNASLMKNEALRNGYDDAIALDASGHVAEGTVANLFIIHRGKLVTPHGATDILEGITRRTVIAYAVSLGIEVEERDVDRSELYTVEEMFICGSSAHITPVLSVDKRPLGDGKIGPITKKIKDGYLELLHGNNPAFRHLVEPLKIL